MTNSDVNNIYKIFETLKINSKSNEFREEYDEAYETGYNQAIDDVTEELRLYYEARKKCAEYWSDIAGG